MLAQRDSFRKEWTEADPEPRDEFAVIVKDKDRSIWKGDYPEFIDRGVEIARDGINRVSGAGDKAKEFAEEAANHVTGAKGKVQDIADQVISHSREAGETVKQFVEDIPGKLPFVRL
jgi:hypothetical protein